MPSRERRCRRHGGQTEQWVSIDCEGRRKFAVLIVTESEQKYHPQIPKMAADSKERGERILKFHWAVNFGFPIKLNRTDSTLFSEKSNILTFSHFPEDRIWLQPLPDAISQLKIHRWLPHLPPHRTALENVPELAPNYKSNPHTQDWDNSGHCTPHLGTPVTNWSLCGKGLSKLQSCGRNHKGNVWQIRATEKQKIPAWLKITNKVKRQTTGKNICSKIAQTDGQNP